MKLNQKQKNYLSHLIEFVHDYKEWEDLGVEAMVAIRIMGGSKEMDFYFHNAIDNHIKKVRKQLGY